MGLRVYRAEISVPFTEKSVPSACFYAVCEAPCLDVNVCVESGLEGVS